MKAILTFNLTNEQDREEFKTASKAMDLRLAIEDILEDLRRKIKYENRADLEPCRDTVIDILKDRGVLDLLP